VLPPSSSAQPIPIQPSQRYVMPNNPSRAIDPNTGLSQAQYDPDNRGVAAQDAPYYYQDRLPEGVQNQLAGRSQLPSPQQIGQANQVNQPMNQNMQAPNRQVQEQPQNLMMLPMNVGQNQMNEQNMQPQLLPEQQSNQSVPENQQQVMVGVGENGNSFSFSGGANQDEQFANQLSDAADQSRREVASMQNQPSGLPSGNNQPYVNPINQNYDPIIPPDPEFPWGKALAIGSGAALGAGLLAYGLSSGNNKRKNK
jgi:hypothetical protein